jgi:hypothetical protein
MSTRKKKPPFFSHKQQRPTAKKHGFSSFLNRMAIFGDSGTALVVSFLMVCSSVLVSLHLNKDRQQQRQDYYQSYAVPAIVKQFSTYESLGAALPKTITTDFQRQTPPPPRIHTVHLDHNGPVTIPSLLLVTDKMRQEYEMDGVICVRGLIPPDLLDRLDVESQIWIDRQTENHSKKRKHMQQFYASVHSIIFQEQNVSSFRELALQSAIPAFAHALLFPPSPQHSKNSNNTGNKLRLIRDIFLAKHEHDQYACGWHVDDLGFWPATPESTGINAWVAMDDMHLHDHHSGFALAVGSHRAAWRKAAYYWTGAPDIDHFPKDGYHNASHLFASRTGHGTCNLETAAPHLHRRMEETSRQYPVRRGDVIFHTRWLFHRTVLHPPSQQSTLHNHISRDKKSAQVYRRYSIRYGPGDTSIVPPGYGTEWSVLWDASNGGRSADEACYGETVDHIQGKDNAENTFIRKSSPWYPQAWPALTGAEEEQFQNDLQALIREKVPTVMQRQASRRREMMPYLQRIAKKQEHQKRPF